MASPLYGVAAMNAIGFGVYGNVIRRLNHPDSIVSITTAGIAAGAVQVSTYTCKPSCDTFIPST
jgi:solute carrier family 25 carnitine/acylcarnitine transporter 20/29